MVHLHASGASQVVVWNEVGERVLPRRNRVVRRDNRKCELPAEEYGGEKDRLSER